jgi:hyperosmotically inducible periplasmic protein
MTMHRRLALPLCAVALLLTAARGTAQTGSPVEDIRKELLRLPYYGVFDFLAFSYDKGTVTLTGNAYSPNLRHSAERAVKRASRVDQVINQVEDLPASTNDDELRWKVYYSIYNDPFLSRYAPGGGMLWGRRFAYSGPFSPMNGGPFLAYEAAGDYPIHIIIKGGRITLLGVVDNDSDKTVAGMRARAVPGSFGVDNHLIVQKPTEYTRR